MLSPLSSYNKQQKLFNISSLGEKATLRTKPGSNRNESPFDICTGPFISCPGAFEIDFAVQSHSNFCNGGFHKLFACTDTIARLSKMKQTKSENPKTNVDEVNSLWYPISNVSSVNSPSSCLVLVFMQQFYFFSCALIPFPRLCLVFSQFSNVCLLR